MSGPTLTHRERVERALAHETTDRPPRDFAAEPDVWRRLRAHYRTDSHEEILRAFDTDCRIVSYDWEAFFRPPDTPADAPRAHRAWKRLLASDSYLDPWGARRTITVNEYSTYEELSDYPLAGAESVEDLARYAWPSPDWWDFSQLRAVIERVNPNREYHLRWRCGSIFETAWSLRGFDRMLLDLVVAPDIAGYIMDRILEIHLENLARVMAAAGDLIDMVYTYDDVASQQALLMSADMWGQLIRPRQERLFAAAKGYGKPLMLHCCGAVAPLIDELIDLGLDVLNPVQPLAAGMDLERLKERYGDRLTFHGGIDIQELLPRGTPEQVRREVERVTGILGRDGGYILGPAHHVQADTPVENVLALYGLS